MKIKYTTLVIIIIVGLVVGYMKVTNTGLFKGGGRQSTSSVIPYQDPGLGQLPSISLKKSPSEAPSTQGKEVLYTAENPGSKKNSIFDVAKKLHIYVTHYSESQVGNVDMTVRVYKENDLVLFKRDLKYAIGARDMIYKFQTRVQEGVNIFEVYTIKFYY